MMPSRQRLEGLGEDSVTLLAITLLGLLGSRRWGTRGDIGVAFFFFSIYLAALVLIAFHFEVQTLVMAHRLGCSAACGILVPQPGIEPEVPALQRWILNHGTIREVPWSMF